MWLGDFATASKWFFRGLNRGDWLLLILAVMISSASITTVELLAKTVKYSMLAQAAENLGADLVVKSSRPIDSQWLEKAKAINLNIAQSQSLITMAMSGDKFQLVQLKAVSKNYPLKGDKYKLDQQILIEPALNPLLNLTESSEILLGTLAFKIAGQFQPKSLSIAASFAKQILMPLTLLEKTGLKGVGSRVTYNLYVAGKQRDIVSFAQQINKTNSPHLQIISAQAPTKDLAQSLDTAWLFLDLSALAAVLVAGLSILIASRFYLQKWQSSIALMRSFGAERSQIFRLFAWQLSWLAVVASTAGVMLGSWLFNLLTPLLADYFQPIIIPSFGWIHLHGFLIGCLVLWAFAWQSFIQAIQSSPLQLLKTTRSSTTPIYSWVISLALIILIIISVTGYITWVLLGLFLISFSLYLGAIGLLTLIGYWQKSSKGWLKISLSSLTREPALVKLQLISVGLVLFILMLMTFVRQDLIQNWQASLPQETPDTFLMNIQPEQKKQVLAILNKQQITTELIAMARGRLIAINNKSLTADKQSSNRARRLLEREANIAQMEFPLSYNKIIQQTTIKLSPSELPKVSVEKGIAELFKLQLNDVLTFSFSGQNIKYRIDSIREVKWQSLRLNFFFIIDNTQSIPISYLANFSLAKKSTSISQLTKDIAIQAPGVLLIDAKKILQQIQTIMRQASWSVSGLYVFILVASLIVLFSATLASQQARVQSWFLLRTMGASHQEIVKIGLMEFVLLGGFAGLLAAIFAQLTSILISKFALQIPPQFSLELWLLSLFLGVSALLIIGLVTQQKYLRLSPHKMAKKWS